MVPKYAPSISIQVKKPSPTEVHNGAKQKQFDAIDEYLIIFNHMLNAK